MVGNHFVPKGLDPLEYQVVQDLMSAGAVVDVPVAYSRRNGLVRELFAFISKIYYFDGGEVKFIKDQVPIRP